MKTKLAIIAALAALSAQAQFAYFSDDFGGEASLTVGFQETTSILMTDLPGTTGGSRDATLIFQSTPFQIDNGQEATLTFSGNTLSFSEGPQLQAMFRIEYDGLNLDLSEAKGARIIGSEKPEGISVRFFDSTGDWYEVSGNVNEWLPLSLAWTGSTPDWSDTQEIHILSGGFSGSSYTFDTFEVSSIPEPHHYAMMTGLGLIGFAIARRKFAAV